MTPWPSKGRFILPFWSFFEGWKIKCFFDPDLGAQKVEKIGPRLARKRETWPRVFGSRGGSCPRGPQGGHARDKACWQKACGKREKGQEGKKASMKVDRKESWNEKLARRNKEGSNTPMGQRPGEYSSDGIPRALAASPRWDHNRPGP